MKLWKEDLLSGLACLPASALAFYVQKYYGSPPKLGYNRRAPDEPWAWGLIFLVVGIGFLNSAYARWKVEKKREAGQLAKQQHRAPSQTPPPKRPPARKADIRYRIASLVLVGLLLFVILSGIGRWGLFD